MFRAAEETVTVSLVALDWLSDDEEEIAGFGRTESTGRLAPASMGPLPAPLILSVTKLSCFSRLYYRPVQRIL
jgi:hypothetical protein